MKNSSHSARIKICGLRDKATIAAMNGLPITEVGLVFAPSKRQVSVELGESLAAAIGQLSCLDGLPPRAAGVFVNEELPSMKQLLDKVPLQVVQLHGQESAEYYAALKESYPGVQLWKVVSIKADERAFADSSEKNESIAGVKSGDLFSPDENRGYVETLMDELTPFVPYIEAILLDAPGGGTGKPFNWEAIAAYKEAAGLLGKQLIVAGGLHEGNVRTLLEQYSIDGVDVSSGVETDGVKDITKIKQFVRRVIEA